MIWLLALSLVTAAATALWPDVMASLFFSVTLFALLLPWLRKMIPEEGRGYVIRMVILAFALRLCCAYLVEGLALIQKNDALTYHWAGFKIAHAALDARFAEIYQLVRVSSHPGYYLLIGAVYSVFGPNILLGQNLNTLVSAITVIPIYLLGREISAEPRVAGLAAQAYAWFPNSVFWSTQLLKDSLIVLVEVVLILDLVRVVHGRSSRRLVFRLILCTLLLAELRFYLPVLIYLSFGMGELILALPIGKRWRYLNPALVAAVLGIVLVGAAVTAKAWTGYLNLHDDIQEFRTSTMGGDSDFAKDADLRTPLGFLEFIPTGLTYFLAGPLPWKARHLTQFLTWLDIPIWYPALALGCAGMLLLLRRREAIPMISACLGLTLFYSVFLANLGTAYRMRLQITPFFLIAAAWFWYKPHQRTRPADCV